MMQSIFLLPGLINVQRLFSLQDRNPASPTFGCFDRFFWHYKKSDMPLSSIQNGVYSQALLYRTKGSEYYNKKKVLDWILAGIDYWCTLQNKDGSFDDYYPNERSPVATAIGLYPIAKTIFLLKDEIEDEKYQQYRKVLWKSSLFLLRRKEHNVANQEAISCAAILAAYKVIDNDTLPLRLKAKIENLLKLQDEEGWFPEYGGFDVGYLSYMIDSLSYIHLEAKTDSFLDYLVPRLETALSKAIKFISYFAHPDYSVGGEYSTRNTEFMLPSGFARYASQTKDSVACGILDFLRKSIATGKGFSPLVLDYRYLPLYLYHYIEAAHYEFTSNLDGTLNILPYKHKDFYVQIPNAGVYIRKEQGKYTIIGTKKGGVIKCFSVRNQKLIYSNCGYVFPLSKKKYATTMYYDHEREIKITKKKVYVHGHYHVVKELVPSVWNHIALRLINKIPFMAKTLRELIKKMFITDLNLMNEKFTRIITFDKGECKVRDELGFDGNGMLLDKFSHKYTPSAKYFNINELNKYGTR